MSLASVIALSGAFGAFKESAAALRVRLAKLSLEDAKWRRTVERSTRQVIFEGDEGAVAVLRGLSRFGLALLDEEEFRAERIVESNGDAVRPREAPLDVRGPLGEAELRLTQALAGHEGNALALLWKWLAAVYAQIALEWSGIVQSERTRTELTAGDRERQGDTARRTRPLDAPPSPLGTFELFADSLLREERARAKRVVESPTTLLSRPSEAPFRDRGPLAEMERRVESLLVVFSSYERRRFQVLKQQEGVRPMETEPDGLLGRAESATVGIYRAPIMFVALVERIKQIIAFELIDDDDDLDDTTTGPPRA